MMMCDHMIITNYLISLHCIDAIKWLLFMLRLVIV